MPNLKEKYELFDDDLLLPLEKSDCYQILLRINHISCNNYNILSLLWLWLASATHNGVNREINIASFFRSFARIKPTRAGNYVQGGLNCPGDDQSI